MSEQTTIPNSERLSVYEPVTPTSSFDVGFVMFDDASDIEVYLDGVLKVIDTDYTVSATFDAAFAEDALVNVIGTGWTGYVEIVGARNPYREDQFKDGRGVPAADQNSALNRLAIETRENFDRNSRSLQLARGGASPDFDANGKRLINLADGVDGGDAVTKGQLDASHGSEFADAAAASAAAAAASQSNASTSETNAAAHEAQTLVYRNEVLGAVPHITFETIAALRAFSAATGATLCQVIGYRNTNQIMGGGMFQLLPSGHPNIAAADDGGFIIVDAAGRRWQRMIRSALNGFEFGAYGDGTTDDQPFLQPLFTFSYGTDIEGPQHGINIPAGHAFRINSPVLIPQAIDFECGSYWYSNMAGQANGGTRAIQIGSQDPASAGARPYNGKFRLAGLRDIHTSNNSTEPTSANWDGVHGVWIVSGQFWRDITIGEIQQFSGAGMLADCRDGVLGWAKQHVQQCNIETGLTAFNGWGHLFISNSAANASFGGNKVRMIDPNRNWLDLQCDGLFGCTASSSNEFEILADDLPATGGIGFSMDGSNNKITTMFKEGNMTFNTNARKNNVVVQNDKSTGFVMNFNGHWTNTVKTETFDEADFTGSFAAPALGVVEQNLTGIDMDISVTANIIPNSGSANGARLIVVRVDDTGEYIADEIVETADTNPHVRQKMLKAHIPSGWKYRFDRVGTGGTTPTLGGIYRIPKA